MEKYDYLTSLQSDLLEKNRILDLAGSIELETYKYIREALLRLTTQGSPDIRVLITSPGGAVDPGLSIYDALLMYDGKKTGRVLHTAQSMGAVILQACDVRQCMRHSTVMIHHVSRGSVSLDALRNKRKTVEMREDLEKSQKRLYTILSQKTGKSIEVIRRECTKENEMTSEEALEFGLIDEILDRANSKAAQ